MKIEFGFREIKYRGRPSRYVLVSNSTKTNINMILNLGYFDFKPYNFPERLYKIIDWEFK